MDRFFKIDKGVVTIQENGLYYVYAQVNETKKKKEKRKHSRENKIQFLFFLKLFIDFLP